MDAAAKARGVNAGEAAARRVLHGMARSKKNDIVPSSKEKSGRKHTSGSIVVVEASGGKGSKGKTDGKQSSVTKKKKSSAKTKKVEANVVDEDEGSMGGTAGAASRNTRDAVREEIMTQVGNQLGVSALSVLWLSSSSCTVSDLGSFMCGLGQ